MSATRSLPAKGVLTGKPKLVVAICVTSILGIGIFLSLSPVLFFRKHPVRAQQLQAIVADDGRVDDRRAENWRATDLAVRPPALAAEPRTESGPAEDVARRAQTPSNEVMTAQFLEELRASGEVTNASWTSSAWNVLEDWRSRVKSAVSFSDFHCFSRGCSARATYADFGSFMHENRVIESTMNWPGPRFHSGPFETSSGAVEAVWILYRDTSAGDGS